MRLYRYRTIKNALLELENGTFYFAEPKELNDPIEGYIKIFWQGDEAAWEGLLKNFVCSLFYNLQTYLLMEQKLGGRQKDYDKDFKNRVVIINLNRFGNSPLNKIFNRLTEEFLSKNNVQEVVNFYGNGNIKCSGKETEFVLQSVVDYACHLCVKECKALGLIENDFDENFFDVAYEISFGKLKNLGAKSLEVKSIKYDEQIIEQNFFDMLCHLHFLNVEDWLTGLKGIKSNKLKESDIADEYDDIYCEKFYRKTFDWCHEREYRIFLPDKFQNYNSKFSRTLKYDLKMLKGIIFGLRTTLEDKLELIQKLVRLRKSVHDFEFYQAEFDDDTQKIYVREKFLLIKSLED